MYHSYNTRLRKCIRVIVAIYNEHFGDKTCINRTIALATLSVSKRISLRFRVLMFQADVTSVHIYRLDSI